MHHAARFFRNSQTVFFGIGAQPGLGAHSRIQAMQDKLFLRHNITNTAELETVLRKAILEALTV